MTKKQRQEGTSAGRCPICKKPTAAAYGPFCSARCRDVDLARWLSGSYAIPGSDVASGAGGAASRNAARDGDEEDEG